MTSQRLVVGPAALAVVTRVGPASWVVLERLALSDRRHGDVAVVSASVRSLAAELGWAKDTVAHALARLRAEGIVELIAEQFQPSAYRLALPADALRVEYVVAPPRAPRASVQSAVPSAAQLSLLEPG